MVTNDNATFKPIQQTWSFRGATVIYFVTLVVRTLYPVFVWSFYVLTAILMVSALSSGRRRR
jgi:hypothetical protein